MNISKPLCLCTFMLLARQMPAAELGPYVAGDLGLSIADDVEASLEVPGVGTTLGDLELDPGFRLGVAVGNRFSQWISAEIESGFVYNPLTHSESWLGHIPLLGNLIVRYESQSGWVPYAGGGIGGALTFLNLEESGLDDDDTDVVLAWQGMAGVRYYVRDNFSIGLGYKYFATESSEYSIHLNTVELGETANHSFGLIVKLDF